MSLPGSNLKWISLVVVTVATFSLVFLIPESPPIKPSRLALQLPKVFNDWSGSSVAISQRELEILADDTSFERINYVNDFDSRVPGVMVSIVFCFTSSPKASPLILLA